MMPKKTVAHNNATNAAPSRAAKPEPAFSGSPVTATLAFSHAYCPRMDVPQSLHPFPDCCDRLSQIRGVRRDRHPRGAPVGMAARRLSPGRWGTVGARAALLESAPSCAAGETETPHDHEFPGPSRT